MGSSKSSGRVGRSGIGPGSTIAVKPAAITTHGTKVVLLGNDEDQNTMLAPEGAASPSRWVTRYLNTRYYRFPTGITVKAREGWENPRSDSDRNVLRTLNGQKAYLIAMPVRREPSSCRRLWRTGGC